MPKKAKDEIKLIKEEKVKKASNSKKVASKKEEKTLKSNTKTSSAKATTKKTNSNIKSNSKETTKVSSAKKSTSKSTSKSRTTKSKKVEILEYYDLPYRYKQTVVKVLAQTPNILFVYWDISDDDRENYIKQYGEYFFNDTKPVLIVYNDTMHYSFEIDINDFANSWYLHIEDSDCDYRVELGRRPINEYAKINNYLYVSTSNSMEAPNDHILFDALNSNVYFRNVKTNVTIKKDISLSFFKKIGKIYNVKDFYKTMYKDEDIDFDRLSFKDVSSS